MAVCPFCLPWPRTSLTVIPETLSLLSASFTSSTLFGRTMHLSNFKILLQQVLQPRCERVLRRRRQLRASLGDVEHVDRLVPFGGDQHQVDIASLLRHHPA